MRACRSGGRRRVQGATGEAFLAPALPARQATVAVPYSSSSPIFCLPSPLFIDLLGFLFLPTHAEPLPQRKTGMRPTTPMLAPLDAGAAPSLYDQVKHAAGACCDEDCCLGRRVRSVLEN